MSNILPLFYFHSCLELYVYTERILAVDFIKRISVAQETFLLFLTLIQNINKSRIMDSYVHAMPLFL